jgi:hypothetical protein
MGGKEVENFFFLSIIIINFNIDIYYNNHNRIKNRN